MARFRPVWAADAEANIPRASTSNGAAGALTGYGSLSDTLVAPAGSPGSCSVAAVSERMLPPTTGKPPALNRERSTCDRPRPVTRTVVGTPASIPAGVAMSSSGNCLNNAIGTASGLRPVEVMVIVAVSLDQLFTPRVLAVSTWYWIEPAPVPCAWSSTSHGRSLVALQAWFCPAAKVTDAVPARSRGWVWLVSVTAAMGEATMSLATTTCTGTCSALSARPEEPGKLMPSVAASVAACGVAAIVSASAAGSLWSAVSTVVSDEVNVSLCPVSGGAMASVTGVGETPSVPSSVIAAVFMLKRVSA